MAVSGEAPPQVIIKHGKTHAQLFQYYTQYYHNWTEQANQAKAVLASLPPPHPNTPSNNEKRVEEERKEKWALYYAGNSAALAHYHLALRNSDGGGVEPCARPTSPPLPPQMEEEDDNDGEDEDRIESARIIQASVRRMIKRQRYMNLTNADATLTTETRKRGSREKKFRIMYNRRRNGVGRNGGDGNNIYHGGGGHGVNGRVERRSSRSSFGGRSIVDQRSDGNGQY